MRRIITIILMIMNLTLCFGQTDSVKLTYYHPTGRPTADGSRYRPGVRWCAVSRDLLKKFPLGSQIKIEGMGIYDVKDTTGAKARKTVDILVARGKGFGLRRNVKVERYEPSEKDSIQ